MAKRRDKPLVNPLSSDLIAAAVAPVVVEPATEIPQPGPLEESVPPAEISTRVSAAVPARVGRRRREHKTLRVRFPETEYEQLGGLTTMLSQLMGGSKVSESDITRALWSLVSRAEDAMQELESKAPKVPRPSNGDWVAKAEYDDAIAHFLHLAIKRVGARE